MVMIFKTQNSIIWLSTNILRVNIFVHVNKSGHFIYFLFQGEKLWRLHVRALGKIFLLFLFQYLPSYL